MNCPIEPSFDRVILTEDAPEEITEGKIIIPAIAQEKTKTSRIVAVGPDCRFFRPGDHVIHTKYAGTEIEVDRVTYLIVAEIELQGKLVYPAA